MCATAEKEGYLLNPSRACGNYSCPVIIVHIAGGDFSCHTSMNQLIQVQLAYVLLRNILCIYITYKVGTISRHCKLELLFD